MFFTDDFGDEVRILPQHIRDEYGSRGFDVDILENTLLKGMKLWSEPDGKEMSRKELVDVYMPSHIKKANKILTDYACGCKSWNWKVWGEKTTIYWMKK